MKAGRARPAGAEPRSPRCVWCGEGWGEGDGGGGFYFFPLFLKRMTAKKFSPLDPLFRCTHRRTPPPGCAPFLLLLLLRGGAGGGRLPALQPRARSG